MKLYVAGPMTGIPQFNFPAFDAIAVELRRYGHDVVSPAELDDPEDRAAALASKDGSALDYGKGVKKTWGKFLARDVELIADGGIECIVVIDGWEYSRGARLETFVGRMMCRLPVYTWDTAYGEFRKVRMLTLAKAWLGVDLSFHRRHPYDIEEAA